MTVCGMCKSGATTTEMARVGSDDVSRSVQRALRCYDDNKDYGMKDIGEEGWGGWVFRMVNSLQITLYKQAHLPFYLTRSVPRLAVHDHIHYLCQAAHKLNSLDRYLPQWLTLG